MKYTLSSPFQLPPLPHTQLIETHDNHPSVAVEHPLPEPSTNTDTPSTRHPPDRGDEPLDGVGDALGVARVQLVGGRVARVDGQLFGRLQHVACSVHHRLPSNHYRLLGLARLVDNDGKAGG